MLFYEISDFVAELKSDVGGTKTSNGKNSPKSNEGAVLFGVSNRDEGIVGTIILGDFSTTTGFGIALVAFFARSLFGVAIIGFTTTGFRVAIFPFSAIFQGGCHSGSINTIAGSLVNNFANWTATELLVFVGGAGGRSISKLPVFGAVRIDANLSIGGARFLTMWKSKRV